MILKINLVSFFDTALREPYLYIVYNGVNKAKHTAHFTLSSCGVNQCNIIYDQTYVSFNYVLFVPYTLLFYTEYCTEMEM